MTFPVQPGLSKFDTPLTGPPTVFVQDPFGNPVPNRLVTMTIGQHASGASTSFTTTPSSTTSVATNSSGLAQFANLNVHLTAVNYTIVATVNVNPSGTSSGQSATFDVANDLKNCNSPKCQGAESSSDNLTFSTVTVDSANGH